MHYGKCRTQRQSVKLHFFFPVCFIDSCTDWWSRWWIDEWWKQLNVAGNYCLFDFVIWSMNWIYYLKFCTWQFIFAIIFIFVLSIHFNLCLSKERQFRVVNVYIRFSMIFFLLETLSVYCSQMERVTKNSNLESDLCMYWTENWLWFKNRLWIKSWPR